jgi:hypothetical protein
VTQIPSLKLHDDEDLDIVLAALEHYHTILNIAEALVRYYSTIPSSNKINRNNTMPAAIVTGSSGGIGKGIALRLAADGFDVIVNDIAPKQAAIDAVVEEIKAVGGKAHGFPADVSKQEDVEALVQEGVKVFGSLGVCFPEHMIFPPIQLTRF